MKRVVVVGGGFGGLTVARALRKASVDIILIDRRNHHLFQPLLYQVATAALSPADIAAPIRRIFRHQRNVQVVLGEVEDVDLDRRRVHANGVEIAYDYLVLAAGATDSYFGNDAWSQHAPGLKSVDDALEIRRRVLSAFEAAELEDDAEARRALLTFVVVGGGPTGVEMAGALREIAVESIPTDFRRVDTREARVILAEGLDRLLPTMSEEASRRARKDLEDLGVEVRLGTLVTNVTDEGVELGGEEFLETTNVIWGAGVRGARLADKLGVVQGRGGRVKVAPDCSIPGFPEAFVIGDMAAQIDAESGDPVPGIAQGAIQMGDHVAAIIKNEVASPGGTERPAFTYRDKGTLATIGRARAVADIRGRSFGGVFAWLLWSLVHIFFLIGFRNKIFVMISWIWNYVVHARGARLITGSPPMRVRRIALGDEPGGEEERSAEEAVDGRV